jgi:hypothetical protein
MTETGTRYGGRAANHNPRDLTGRRSREILEEKHRREEAAKAPGKSELDRRFDEGFHSGFASGWDASTESFNRELTDLHASRGIKGIQKYLDDLTAEAK